MRRRPVLRLGVLGAVLAFVAIASLTALVTRPFLPADESSNVAYSLTVSRGELPRIDAPVKSELPGQRELPVNYVANHPPLYYLLVSPGLRYAVDSGHWRLGIALARLETVVLSFGTVVLTAALAVVLVGRRRPDLVVGAAALMAMTSSYAVTGGVVHNDGMATTLLAGQLAATVLVLVRGLRLPLVLTILVTAAVGLLTRVSNLGLIALSAAALVVAGVLHANRGRVRGALRGLAWAGGLVGLCAASAGWFYAHNAREYGDFTGGDEVVKLLRMPARPGSVVYHAVKPETVNDLVSGTFGLDPDAPGLRTGLVVAMFVVVAAGAAVLAVRVVRRLGRRSHPGAATVQAVPGAPAERRELIVAAIAALLVVHVAIVLLEIGSHVKDGGGAQSRYLFPALPVLAIAAAAALLALPGRLGRVALTVAIVSQAALTLRVVESLAGRSTGRADSLGSLVPAIDRSGVPLPAVLVGALLLIYAVGLVLVIGAIWVAPRARPPARGRHLAAAHR
jgi:hypothetical protein